MESTEEIERLCGEYENAIAEMEGFFDENIEDASAISEKRVMMMAEGLYTIMIDVDDALGRNE